MWASPQKSASRSDKTVFSSPPLIDILSASVHVTVIPFYAHSCLPALLVIAPVPICLILYGERFFFLLHMNCCRLVYWLCFSSFLCFLCICIISISCKSGQHWWVFMPLWQPASALLYACAYCVLRRINMITMMSWQGLGSNSGWNVQRFIT